MSKEMTHLAQWILTEPLDAFILILTIVIIVMGITGPNR